MCHGFRLLTIFEAAGTVAKNVLESEIKPSLTSLTKLIQIRVTHTSCYTEKRAKAHTQII